MEPRFLDNYCERAGDVAFWAEPFNAVTNLAFLIAAAVAYRSVRETCPSLTGYWYVYFPTALVFLIGLGSGAFHTMPALWSVLADVIPITLFIHFYLGAFLNRILGLRWWIAVLIVIAFFVAGATLGRMVPPGTLNSTTSYLPAYAAMVVLTVVLYMRAHPERTLLLATTLIWTASLTFRTIDHDVCHVVSFGTHGFWHMLNAVVLYMLLAILIRNEARLAR